jgi:uncharacterized DUF497 family protein
MRIYEIIWKDVFIEKLARKHGVQIYEAEEALQTHSFIRRVAKGNVKGEDVYAAYAQIQSGRYLIVVFIKKKGNKILPISARDMDEAERRYYEKHT